MMLARLRGSSARAWIALAAITGASAALRLPTLGSQSYWYDEAITVSLLHRSFLGMLRGVAHGESAPPLYYVLGWAWARCFGTGELELRLLSALVGIATVPVAFAAARTLARTRAALAVAGLAATSPVLVWYSQEARAYALLVLLTSASFLFFGRSLADPTARTLTLWAMSSALALATHYFAVFVIVPEVLVLFWRYADDSRVRRASASLILWGAALLPLAVVQTRHNRFAWIGHIRLSTRAGDALRRLLMPAEPSTWWGATGVHYRPFLWVPAVALALLAGGALLLRGAPAERRAGAVAFGIGLAAFGGAILLGLAADELTGGRGDSFLDRNVLSAWLPLNLFVATGLTIRSAGRAGAVAAGALCLGAAALTLVIATDTSLQRDDWRSAARETDGPREAVIVYPAYQAAALLAQRPRLRDLPSRGAEVRRIVLLLPGFTRPPDSFRPPRPFGLESMRKTQNFTIFRYRARRSLRVRPPELVHGPVGESDLRLLVSPT